jgi:hypothetical protein
MWRGLRLLPVLSLLMAHVYARAQEPEPSTPPSVPETVVEAQPPENQTQAAGGIVFDQRRRPVVSQTKSAVPGTARLPHGEPRGHDIFHGVGDAFAAGTYFYESQPAGLPAAEDFHFHPVEPLMARGSVTWKF